MIMKSLAKTASALAAVASLAACTGTVPPPPPGGGGGGGGSSASLVVTGAITGFGSVFVNGVKYEVENGTVVAIEDEAETFGDDSALKVGMKVTVNATEDNGVRTAQHIEYDEDVKGPARNVTPDASDPSIGTFTAVGLLVTVDGNTLFDNDVGDNNGDGDIDIRDLAVPAGQVVVEVSGFPTDSGLLATRIDRVNAPGGIGDPNVDDDELEVKGFVESVDLSSFVVNGTTFQVDGNTLFEDGLVLDQTLVGVFVEVKADEIAPDTYLAVRVQREDDFDDEGEFEIEGVLQAVDTAADPDTFTINGITVPVTDASSLVPLVGQRVEIKGTFDANGVLVISEQKVEQEASVRTEDLVSAIPGDGTFTTRLGLVITPTGGSRIEYDTDDDSIDGDSLTPQEFLDLLQSQQGPHRIEARGVPNGGAVDWTRVEREDQDDQECRLRGPVESVESTAFSFVILGVTVTTDQVDGDDFKGPNDEILTRQQFFDQLDVGDVVQATSDDDTAVTDCRPGMLVAKEVEFEPNDSP
jgi:hypothetical protein